MVSAVGFGFVMVRIWKLEVGIENGVYGESLDADREIADSLFHESEIRFILLGWTCFLMPMKRRSTPTPQE